MTKLGKHTENKERIGQARRDWTRVKKELSKQLVCSFQNRIQVQMQLVCRVQSIKYSKCVEFRVCI